MTPKLFNVYDIKFGEKNQVQLSENKDYKNFVDKSKVKTKKAKGGFISKPTPYMDKPLQGGMRDI